MPDSDNQVSWLKRTFRNSYFYQLPWKQVCRWPILAMVVLPMAALAIFSLPQIASKTYQHAVASGTGPLLALLQAFAVSLFILAYLALHAGLLLAFMAMIWQIVSSTREALPKIWSWLKSVPTFLAGLPAAWKQADTTQRVLVLMGVLYLAAIASFAYFGWSTAVWLVDSAPAWLNLSSSTDWHVVTVIDLFGATWLATFLVLSLLSFVRILLSRFSSKR